MSAVLELWRFPVKSLQGENVDHVDVDERGVVGDRRLAIVDCRTGLALSAKTVPSLLEAEARTASEGVRIKMPNGAEVPATAEANPVLSAWLDRDVELRRAAVGESAAYEMTFNPPDDSADLVEIRTPSGTYLDWGALHLLTTTSLESCAARSPATAWDRRRFRPNVLIEASAQPDGLRMPYPEEDWIGQRMQLGGVTATVDMRTVRCSLPLRAQPPFDGDPELPRDVTVFRTMAAANDNHLGVYASVSAAGRVSVGDEVRAVP